MREGKESYDGVGRYGVVSPQPTFASSSAYAEHRPAPRAYSDLRLAAEIGQALLRKHDDLAASVSTTEARHSSQVDALMSKLTRSIKESKDYEKRLAATSLNLEAADSSNRALLAELDDCRRELSRVKAEKAKMSSSEGKAARLARELEDAQQEVAAERKRTAAAEARAKRASERAAQLTESLKKTVDEGKVARQSERARLSDDIVEAAKERFRASMAAAHPEGSAADASSSSAAVDASELAAMASQNEALERQVDQTSALLEAANEELAALREERANWTATTNASASRGSIPFLGRSAHTRSASGISDAHRDPKRSSLTLQQHHLQHLQDAAAQSSGNEDPSSVAGQPSPSLADELVSHEMVAQPSRSPSGRPLSLSLHRPLLLSDRSNSRASARSDASSPRLGGQSRLLSPTMPYFDPSAAASANMSTTATAGGSASPSTTVDSTATIPASAGRRSVSSDAQKIRAAYIAQQQQQQQSAPSESGSTSDTTSLSLATSTSTAPTSHAAGIAGPSRVPSSSMPPPPTSAAPKRDPRTAHLLTLLDYVQRLYSRLSTADVDTLARRLQRQHLAGDVGHLAKVTINGITRDAEGLREHFRRLIEQEARANAAAAATGQPTTTSDAASSRSSEAASGSATAASTPESLLTRKDFFTLVKLLRDVLFELARLRSCINEVQLAPHQAAKILNEHLHGGAAGGVKGQEDKGVGGWFGRILAGGLAVAGGGGSGGAGGGQPVAAAHATQHNNPPAATLSPQMGVTNVLTGAAAEGGEGNASPGGGHAQAASGGISRPPSRGPSSSSGSVPTVPQLHRAASRGSAAASRPSTVAVEVKGGTRLTSAEFAVPQGERPSPNEPAPAGGLLRAGPRATRGRASLGVPGGSGGAPHPHLLSRVQSRNLSGLFAGAPADAWESLRSTSGGPGANGDARITAASATAAAAAPNAAAGPYGRNRPLSRIVDDDEVSLHHGKPAWAGSSSDVEEEGQNGGHAAVEPGNGPLRRRARGLSDSSIHSTFLEDAAARQEANARQGHGLGISNATGAGAGASGGGAAPATRIMSRATLALQAPIALRGAGGGSAGPATVTRAYGSSRQYGEEDDEDGDTASTLSVKASAPSSSSGGGSAAPTSSSSSAARSGRPSTAGGSSSGGLLAGFGQSVWSNLPSLRPQPSSATLNTNAAASAAALLSSSPGAGGGGGGVGRPGGGAGGMGPAGGWGAI